MTDFDAELARLLRWTIAPARWGVWALAGEEDFPVLRAPGWEVQLTSCTSPATVLDWLTAVTRSGAGDATVAGLLRALDDLLNLRQRICPGGLSKQLQPRQIRALVAEFREREAGS